MRVGTVGDHRDDAGDAEFRAFFDRPFHAIEFEDGEQESEVRCRCGGDFVAEFEFDAAVGDFGDSSSTDYRPAAISNSWPMRARRTRIRWSACSPVRAA